jgi:hypothetical protein
VDKRCATEYDPRQLTRADLERLRREFDRGERLAVNEAYILCCTPPRTPLPRWLAEALRKRLGGELKKSKPGEMREPSDQFIARDNVNLLNREQAYQAGYELALWDELLAYGREELSPRLMEHLTTVVLEKIKSKSGRGRKSRAMQEQRQIWEDFRAFTAVEYYLEEQFRWKNGRATKFSLRRAYEHAANDLDLEPPIIRDAYLRAKKRNKEGFYLSELFLRTITIQ